MIRKVAQMAKVIALGLALSSCAPSQQYPQTAGRDINPNFEFENLKVALDVYKGTVFQLAGEIVQAKSVSNGTLILAQRKWVREDFNYPGYRPEETGEAPPDQFLLSYPRTIDAQGLMVGNKFIAVAELVGLEKDNGMGASQSSQLAFRARCMHVWKTGKSRISDFLDQYPQLYAPLEEDTYCAGASQSSPRD